MIIRYLLTTILMPAFLSCKSLKTEQDIYGDFYKKGQDFEYSLTLKKDNTFSLSMKYQDANPTCVGSWTNNGYSEISLSCDEVENATETISSGYMNEREHKVKIVSRNRIKFKNVILKRK